MLGNITAFQCVAEIMLQCSNLDSTQGENRCGQGHWYYYVFEKNLDEFERDCPDIAEKASIC